jgi:hypothetical protein
MLAEVFSPAMSGSLWFPMSLAFDHCGANAGEMFKRQRQRSELLSDVDKNAQKIKKTFLKRVLTGSGS